jgi:hypothetical protein
VSPHDHTQQDESRASNVSTALSVLAVGGILAAGTVMIAPHILPALGAGSEEMAARSMWMLHESSGLAGTLNEGLAAVPFIGSKLAEGGFFNAIVTGIVGVGGVMLGDSIGQKENGETAVRWGKFIRYGALVTSALVALPTVLTALGSGIIFLSTLAEDSVLSSNIVSLINSSIGTMAGVDHPMTGLSGITAALPHFITCGASLLPAALSFKLWRDDKKTENALSKVPGAFIAKDKHGNPLPANDANHHITQDEFELMERYNNASPTQKILLKKEILKQGYEPDFHDDGTIHLYKHPEAARSATR